MNINELAANLGLEADEYMELLELLVDSGREDITSLEKAMAANDADGVVKAAHSIKGAAANLGLTGLSETARDVEFSAREGNLEGMTEKMQPLKAEFTAIVEVLQT
jgi:histidine phosphotransfer protein HptB